MSHIGREKAAIEEAWNAAVARYKTRWPPTVARVERDLAHARGRRKDAAFALDAIRDAVARRVYLRADEETDESDDDLKLEELASDGEKAAWQAAETKLQACELEVAVTEQLLIEAKLAQQNARPNSIRAASGGRVSPR